MDLSWLVGFVAFTHEQAVMELLLRDNWMIIYFNLNDVWTRFLMFNIHFIWQFEVNRFEISAIQPKRPLSQMTQMLMQKVK